MMLLLRQNVGTSIRLPAALTLITFKGQIVYLTHSPKARSATSARQVGATWSFTGNNTEVKHPQ
jgi:hypothetical protein